MLPKNFYENVEDPTYLNHILYGDSVSEEMKSVVRFKNSNIEYISFKDIWDRLSSNNQIIIKNNKEYILITDQIEIITYDVHTDSWRLEFPQYIMRHHIDQEITRLNFTNFSHLDVTNDHSMVDYNPIKKDLIIKKPKEMKYVPVILRDFSISEDQIDYKYWLLGLWFGDKSLPKSHLTNKFQYPTISNADLVVLSNMIMKNSLDEAENINCVISDKFLNNLINDHTKLISFIIGLWIANGSFDNKSIIIISANQKLLEQIQMLLMIIGIYSHIKIDKKNGDMFELSTSLNKKLIEILQKFEFLKDLPEKLEFSTSYYGEGNRQDLDFQVCEELKYAHLFQLKPIKVTSSETINYSGYVYDFSVPKTECFIANGVLVHNTDSLFIAIPTPNTDELTTEKKLEIADKVSEGINEAINKYLIEYLLPKSNISINQNCTYFKSEMLMESIMLLDIKKNYAYKILAKKGKIFKNPKVNYTGIQVVKSNAAKITQDMLREMIEDVILNTEVAAKNRLAKLSEIINSYYNKFIQACNDLELGEIGFPGKWQKKAMFVDGMKLYNFIMEKEIFSLGSAGNFIYCIFHNPKIFTNMDMSKVNGIVIPHVYDKDLLKQKMQKYLIEIDHETQWTKLFTTTVGRIVDLVKNQK